MLNKYRPGSALCFEHHCSNCCEFGVHLLFRPGPQLTLQHNREQSKRNMPSIQSKFKEELNRCIRKARIRGNVIITLNYQSHAELSRGCLRSQGEWETGAGQTPNVGPHQATRNTRLLANGGCFFGKHFCPEGVPKPLLYFKLRPSKCQKRD